jgi:hypothetical protein
LVSNAFKQERARVHALIERHLKQPSTSLRPVVEDLVVALVGENVEHTLKADLSELASVSRLRDDVALIEASTTASIRREQPRRKLFLMAGGATLVVALLVWLLTPTSPNAPQAIKASPLAAASAAPIVPIAQGLVASVVGSIAAVGTSTPPTAAEPAATAPGTIQITIIATPPEANITMDGVPVHGNPFTARMRADSELHLIRAGGPGLQNQERVINLDHDHLVSFALTRLAAPARPIATHAAKKPAGAPASAAASAANAVDANPAAHAEPGNAPRSRARTSDSYDAPLTTDTAPRKIYDEDPYR